MKEISFIEYGYRMKVSRNCETHEGQYVDDGHLVITMIGSANDILKGIKAAEAFGYYPTFTTPTILRTGRRYELTIDDTTKYWSVGRIDNRAV